MTLLVDTITRAPFAYGPWRARLGDTLPPALEVTLHRRDDLVTPVATLDTARARRFQEQLSAPGSATVTVQHDDALVGLVTDGADVLRWSVHGRVVFASLIREAEHRPVAEGEEAAQTTTFSGPGTLAVLDTALVYPPAIATVADTSVPVQEDRIFGWTAPDYDDSRWPFARELAQVFDATPAWHGMRAGWTGAAAWWIGPSSGTLRLAPGGSCYLRRRFVVEGDTAVPLVVMFAADDGATVWLDNAELGATEEWGNLPSNVYTVSATVAPGEHVIAVRLDNSTAGPAIIDGEPFNPTGLVCALHRAGPDGTLGAAIVVSDDAWRIREFPPQPPGMTPGAVLRIIVTEAQARGALPGVALAFDDETDSDGEPWPVVPDIATKIGTDCWTFAAELAASYIDIWMEPTSWRLHAWRRDGRGSTRPVSLRPATDPTDPRSGSLRALTQREAR